MNDWHQAFDFEQYIFNRMLSPMILMNLIFIVSVSFVVMFCQS